MEYDKESGSTITIPQPKTTLGKFKKIAVDFTQDTTLHGIRYIFLDTPYVLRRYYLIKFYTNRTSKHTLK